MTTDEKLKHFMDVSIESATNQSTKMKEDYKNALNQIFEEHKADANRQAALQLKHGAANSEREINKELSQEQIRIRRKMSDRQNELKEKLFVEIHDILTAFMSTAAYQELLIKQIKEAKKFARGEEIIIYLDPADSSSLRSLEVATNTHLTISEYGFSGGTRAVIHSKNILIDNSFETKLKEAKEAFTFINK